MENQNNNGVHYNYVHNTGLNDNDLKFGKTYHVIDAFIDTVNLPENRRNALKFGIKAIGELLSEFPHERNNQAEKPEGEIHVESESGNVKSDPNAPVNSSK